MEHTDVAYVAEPPANENGLEEVSMKTETIKTVELVAAGEDEILPPNKIPATPRNDSSDSVAGSTTDDGETEEEDAEEGER